LVQRQVTALASGALAPEDVRMPGTESWAYASAQSRSAARAASSAADAAERARKREARAPNVASRVAQSTRGIKAKLLNERRFKEKISMKKTIAAHEERDVEHKRAGAQRHSLTLGFVRALKTGAQQGGDQTDVHWPQILPHQAGGLGPLQRCGPRLHQALPQGGKRIWRPHVPHDAGQSRIAHHISARLFRCALGFFAFQPKLTPRTLYRCSLSLSSMPAPMPPSSMHVMVGLYFSMASMMWLRTTSPWRAFVMALSGPMVKAGNWRSHSPRTPFG
jgi:hypothetical protein